MERQYIGARYVPKFADPVTWNKALSYEAMTIVTHLGNSFTSKIPVPAGIDISNTTYWVNTGNFNAQVNQLTNDVAKVKGDVTAISEDVTSLNGDVADLSANVTALNGDVASLSAYTANPFKGVKGIFLGDSLNQTGGWGEKLKSMLGADGIVVGNGSAGFTIGGNTPPYVGMNFAEMLSKATEGYTTEQKAEFKFCILGGGINDYNASADDVKTGAMSVMNLLNSQFPNVKMYYFPDNTFLPRLPSVWANYKAASEVIATQGGAVCFDLAYVCYDNFSWSSDKVHMTDDGYSSYATRIKSWLLGGSPIYVSPVTFNLDRPGDTILDYTGECKGGFISATTTIRLGSAIPANTQVRLYSLKVDGYDLSTDLGSEYTWQVGMAYDTGGSVHYKSFYYGRKGNVYSTTELPAGAALYINTIFQYGYERVTG